LFCFFGASYFRDQRKLRFILAREADFFRILFSRNRRAYRSRLVHPGARIKISL
jgi:hypothetical protein